ncbi:MAG TPA: Clp protease N-terminal domain-containing protein [Gemmataceae bacterium]|nr:Clp protease N-terminal domain-containing protein [Gemmataceae bacterium]
MDYASVWCLLQCAFPGFTDRAIKVLSVAREQADALHQKLVTPEHVLQALAAVEPGVGRVALERLGIDFEREGAQIAAIVQVVPRMLPDDYHSFSDDAERLIAEAKVASKELGHRYVDTEHLVCGLLRCGPCAAGNFLRTRRITVERFREKALGLVADNE